MDVGEMERDSVYSEVLNPWPLMLEPEVQTIEPRCLKQKQWIKIEYTDERQS